MTTPCRHCRAQPWHSGMHDRRTWRDQLPVEQGRATPTPTKRIFWTRSTFVSSKSFRRTGGSASPSSVVGSACPRPPSRSACSRLERAGVITGLSRRARPGRARIPRLGDRPDPSLAGPAPARARGRRGVARGRRVLTGSRATTATSCGSTCARSTISRRSSTASRRPDRRRPRSCIPRQSLAWRNPPPDNLDTTLIRFRPCSRG